MTAYDLSRVMLRYDLSPQQAERWAALMVLPIEDLPAGALRLVRREYRKLSGLVGDGDIIGGALAEFVRRTTRYH